MILIGLAFEATIFMLFLSYFQVTACLANIHLSACARDSVYPWVLSLYLFYLYVYTEVGRFFDWNNPRYGIHTDVENSCLILLLGVGGVGECSAATKWFSSKQD